MQNLFIISLFRINAAAKNLSCYPVANQAFRLLLWLNYKAKKPLIVTEVETETWYEQEGWQYPFVKGQGSNLDHHNTYYDLLVLRYGAEYACIPMPLVEEDNPLWYALERAVFKDKQEHRRDTFWENLAYRFSGTVTRKRYRKDGTQGRSLQYKSYYNPLQFALLWLQGWRLNK